MERLFIAAPLTAAARQALGDAIAAAFPGGLPGRTTPAENWHLTLRFLGDTPPHRSALVARELESAVAGAPFVLALGGWGAFPTEARAGVLWIGVREGAETLAGLAAAAESAARAAGFPAETRPFSPHLTLSRLRPPLDLREALSRAPELRIEMPVREVTLYRSHAGAGGARYEALRRFPLG